MNPTDMLQEAQRILQLNDRGRYTVPTHGLYPFQWNWDSCLTALGQQRLDADRPWVEIETLIRTRGGDAFVAAPGVAWYVFAGVSGQVVARDAFLDGLLFQSSAHVRRNWLLGAMEVAGAGAVPAAPKAATPAPARAAENASTNADRSCSSMETGRVT